MIKNKLVLTALITINFVMPTPSYSCSNNSASNAYWLVLAGTASTFFLGSVACDYSRQLLFFKPSNQEKQEAQRKKEGCIAFKLATCVDSRIKALTPLVAKLSSEPLEKKDFSRYRQLKRCQNAIDVAMAGGFSAVLVGIAGLAMSSKRLR